MLKTKDTHYIHLLIILWSHLENKRKFQIYGLFVLVLISSFAEVFSIGSALPFLAILTSPEKVLQYKFLSGIINFCEITEPKELIFPLTMIFVIAVFFSGIMRMSLLWVQTKLSHSIGSDLSLSVYRSTLYKPYLFHMSMHSSNLINTVSGKTTNVVYYVIIPILQILASTFMLMTVFGILLSINPKITFLILLTFIFLYFLIVLISYKKIKYYGETINSKSSLVAKLLQEGFGGIRDIILDNSQEIYCKIYKNADIPVRSAHANVQIISYVPRFIIETIIIISIALLAFYLTVHSQSFISMLPLFGMFALASQRLLPIIQSAYASFSSLNTGKNSLEDVLMLLDSKCKIVKPKKIHKKISFQNHIEMRNISFFYPRNKNILNSINLKIKKGSRVGIVGKTGSGKTTLLDIVMGLLIPTSGSLLIDNNKIDSTNIISWQANIAHVPQFIFLTDASVMENIAFGSPMEEIDIERVKVASFAAQLDGTIKSWPEGYDTKIGERGIRLSGGQRQRIGIARALYKNAEIIILDEATSALDIATEKLVMEEITKLNKNITIIIVAHRLTTLYSCDKILEISSGKISYSGNYKKTIRRMSVN